MNNCVRTAIAIFAVGLAAPVAAQIRYELGGAVGSISLQGSDVVVDIHLLILDEHGKNVAGFESTPGNPRTVEVRAFLCTAANSCRYEKMTSVVGWLNAFDAYYIRARIPANSRPFPGGYLTQAKRRLFWVSARQTKRDLSGVNGTGPVLQVVGQGSTLVSASGS